MTQKLKDWGKNLAREPNYADDLEKKKKTGEAQSKQFTLPTIPGKLTEATLLLEARCTVGKQQKVWGSWHTGCM